MFCCTNTLILPSQGARYWRIVGSPQLLQENILSQPWKPYSVLPSLCKSEWFYWHMNSTEQQLNLSLKNLQSGWASLFSLGSVQNLMQTLNMLIPPPRVVLESGKRQSSFAGKYVKIVFKELTDPPGTYIPSCNHFLLLEQWQQISYLAQDAKGI